MLDPAGSSSVAPPRSSRGRRAGGLWSPTTGRGTKGLLESHRSTSPNDWWDRLRHHRRRRARSYPHRSWPGPRRHTLVAFRTSDATLAVTRRVGATWRPWQESAPSPTGSVTRPVRCQGSAIWLPARRRRRSVASRTPEDRHHQVDRPRPRPMADRRSRCPVDSGQLRSGSTGWVELQARSPGCRRSTSRHSVVVSGRKMSGTSPGTTYQLPSSISASSWPAPQPA